MKLPVVASLFLATTAFSVDREHQRYEKEPTYEEWEYYNQDDVYNEVLEFEGETGILVLNNFNICIENLCQYFHHGDDLPTTQVYLAKKKKRPNVGSGVKKILGDLGVAVKGGGGIKLKGVRVKADGSYEIDQVYMWFGGAAGDAGAPIPGYENGKQVHHK